MAGNAEKNRENAAKQKAKVKARDKENTKNATGRGAKPGVGSKKWAQDKGLDK